MSSRIISQSHTPGISLLTKNVTKLLHQPGVDCSPFPWTFIGNPGVGEKSYPTAKNLLIRKISLNRFKSFNAKVSFLPHQTAIFKLSSYAIFICICSPFCCILNFSLYVHICQANLTNQCLLNVVFSMTKVLNDWSSPKQNFHSVHLSILSLPQMIFRKPCFYYCVFSSFSHSFFYFKLYKISTDSTSIGILWLVG